MHTHTHVTPHAQTRAHAHVRNVWLLRITLPQRAASLALCACRCENVAPDAGSFVLTHVLVRCTWKFEYLGHLAQYLIVVWKNLICGNWSLNCSRFGVWPHAYIVWVRYTVCIERACSLPVFWMTEWCQIPVGGIHCFVSLKYVSVHHYTRLYVSIVEYNML